MVETWIGDRKQPNGPKCNIFLSQDFYTNTDRCLVLIQGSGECRAGFWARSLCINENLYYGSMLPMVQFAIETGQSVIILNPNMAQDPFTGEPIKNCSTKLEHGDYVWRNYITASKCPAKTLSIMAHSAGGKVTAALFKEHKKEFLKRVKSLVFTDAYYHDMFNYATKRDKAILAEIGIHFKIFR